MSEHRVSVEYSGSPVDGAVVCCVVSCGLCGVPLTLKKNNTQTTATLHRVGEKEEGVRATGAQGILRLVARGGVLSGSPSGDAFAASEVDQWLDATHQLDPCDPASLDSFVVQLNQALRFRTFLAGYSLSSADVCVWAALKTHTGWAHFFESKKKEGKDKEVPHVERWVNYLERHKAFQGAMATLWPQAQQAKSKTGSQGSFSKLELPGARMGAVVTRFPPEPSGYLHIGHAKAAFLNNYYAEHYKGKLVVRFDDTNPAKEKEEYVHEILRDLSTLGINPPSVSYTSDFFPQILQFAEQLIKDQLGFVDPTPKEQMSEERDAGIESKYRTNTVEENLRLWNEMKSGSPEGIKCVLRGKIDMSSLNKALRDPALFRCNDTPHQRAGSKYKVYPLYDFACPIVDSLEGVTHSLRSSEYHDRNPLYYWVVDSCKLRRPYIQDFARLNFSYTLLSKRKLQMFVDWGYVSGWNDPRFPTIQGLIRRGLTVEALKEFVISQGASKSVTLMDIEKLWAVNKKVIDPIAPRYTAVANGGVPFTLTDGPKIVEHRSVPLHKKNPSLGNKVVAFTSNLILEKEDAALISKGEEVTLMDWGNAVVDTINFGEDGKVASLIGHLHLEGSVKETKKKLTWLAATDELVNVTLCDFDHLITKKKLEEGDKLEDFVNHNSEFKTAALGDANLRLLQKGQAIQLERRGYYICDEPYLDPTKPVVLFNTPDGHTSKEQSVLTSAKPKKSGGDDDREKKKQEREKKRQEKEEKKKEKDEKKQKGNQ